MEMTKESIAAEVITARSAHVCDEIWRRCREYGYAPGGQTHAMILRRKAELGGILSDHEHTLIRDAEYAREQGTAQPPITGRLHL